MKEEWFNERLEAAKHGCPPAFLGAHITAEQFYLIFVTLSEHINTIGWYHFKRYIDHLLCRLETKEQQNIVMYTHPVKPINIKEK